MCFLKIKKQTARNCGLFFIHNCVAYLDDVYLVETYGHACGITKCEMHNAVV